VQFLTARTSEGVRRLQRAISDFKKEHPNGEFRVYPKPEELHDRYIIGEDYVLILGHGIKDIGSKESFIIRLDSQIAADLVVTLTSSFDHRWSEGKSI
jgi:pyruvate/2-oxoglutarate dehydrogenase complex dihydrolipoamide acyltransferase (E2) component